jgi:hypothetical protein
MWQRSCSGLLSILIPSREALKESRFLFQPDCTARFSFLPLSLGALNHLFELSSHNFWALGCQVVKIGQSFCVLFGAETREDGYDGLGGVSSGVRPNTRSILFKLSSSTASKLSYVLAAISFRRSERALRPRCNRSLMLLTRNWRSSRRSELVSRGAHSSGARA